MIKFGDLTSYGDMCCGMSYSGKCTFEGKNVREVLEEIKEYTTNPKNTKFKKINGFGNSDEECGCAWAIHINGCTYLSTWNGGDWWRKQYQGEYDDCEVETVSVNGGWYCAYNFHIKVKGVE